MVAAADHAARRGVLGPFSKLPGCSCFASTHHQHVDLFACSFTVLACLDAFFCSARLTACFPWPLPRAFKSSGFFHTTSSPGKDAISIARSGAGVEQRWRRRPISHACSGLSPARSSSRPHGLRARWSCGRQLLMPRWAGRRPHRRFLDAYVART